MANKFSTDNYSSREPEVINAGDRVAWKRSDLVSDYPPAEYKLSYEFKSDQSNDISENVIATGNHVVEISSTVTNGYTADTYHWAAYITRLSDDERVMVDSGRWTVKPNLDSMTGDPRSKVQLIFESIEAVISNRATKDQESYSIAGRSLQRTPITDLIVLRDKYYALWVHEQRSERASQGLGHSGIIKVRL